MKRHDLVGSVLLNTSANASQNDGNTTIKCFKMRLYQHGCHWVGRQWFSQQIWQKFWSVVESASAIVGEVKWFWFGTGWNAYRMRVAKVDARIKQHWSTGAKMVISSWKGRPNPLPWSQCIGNAFLPNILRFQGKVSTAIEFTKINLPKHLIVMTIHVAD